MTVQPYTADNVKQRVAAEATRLFASYAVGRSSTWSCCSRTRDAVCLGRWIAEELERLGIDAAGRLVQQRRFDRMSASADDLWELASQLLNEAAIGLIPRDRRRCRRWE